MTCGETYTSCIIIHIPTHIQVCQWDSTANQNVGAFSVIGTAEEVIWDVESVTQFTVTFGKGAVTWKNEPRYVITIWLWAPNYI